MYTAEIPTLDSQKLKTDLYKMIGDYFRENNLSKLANGRMYSKIIFGFTWWIASLVMLFTIPASPAVYFFLYVFHIFSQLYIMLNVGHDANHDAIFKNKTISKLFHYSFDITGINSYMWREMHHNQHHYVMNVDGYDEVLIARKLFRFTKRAKMRYLFRFQHIYTFFLYSLFAIDFVWVKDYECFFFPYTDSLKANKPPFIEYVKLFLFKGLYVWYMLYLPVYYLHYSWGLVLAAYLVGNMLIGIIGAMVIQVSHQLSSAEFPESKKEYKTFVDHVFATTADHSLKDPIANWCYGGLHLHIIHHLAPDICHAHYIELTKRIKPIAIENHAKYRMHKNIFGAIKEHYILLKQLSKDVEAENSA